MFILGGGGGGGNWDPTDRKFISVKQERYLSCVIQLIVCMCNMNW